MDQFVVKAFYLEVELDETLGTTTIPTVWTAPPTWPPAPEGFEPPDGWVAPVEWGPAPPGWVFFQPDPLVYGPWKAQRDELAERSAVMLMTPAALISVLNYLERRLASAVVVRARLTSDALRASAGHASDFTAAFHAQLDQRTGNVASAASGLRDYALHCLRNGQGVDDGHYQKLRQVLQRTASLLDADFNRACAAIWADGEDGNAARALNATSDIQALIAEHHIHITPRYESDDEPSGEYDSGAPAWELAEELAAEWLRENGYPDARRTPVGADGGFDVEARGLVAQVKHRAKPTGREEIQRLVGANLHGANLAFFSTGGYTTQAVQYAKAAGVALYGLDVSTGTVDFHY
ncbi:restriction endonuclease [Sanguibacter sp. 25GB23B1]|uniref:restriction endonuclease n=1 Tax=unclassified Sanguibacter TaxID=2645534 RepID=UPI0032AEE4C9